MNKGYTLMHEHLTINLSMIKQDDDTRLDCFQETLNELKKLSTLGVNRIVDVTNMGMGRNIQYVKRLEAASGIRIICATGFYKEPFLPSIVEEKTVTELSNLMIAEICHGIDHTDQKAQIIGEIGTSLKTMTALEQKVFDASIATYQRMKIPIYTHTTLGTMGYDQAQYLISSGVQPRDIVIGHMDLCQNYNEILSVLEIGAMVGFDTIGKNNYQSDEKRVEYLVAIKQAGYLKQVVLSMDITRKSQLKLLGYTYLFNHFIPMLKEAGFNKADIHQLLVDNPNRLLEGY